MHRSRNKFANDAGTASVNDGSHELEISTMPVIGREPPADVIVPATQVSARHAMIEPLGEGEYRLSDLGSTNGTFVNGRRVNEALVSSGDHVTLGSQSLDWHVVAESLVQHSSARARPEGHVFYVGRGNDNDLSIGDARVSANHATLTPVGPEQLEISDLDSSNGTYVNGMRVTNAIIMPEDYVTFGSMAVNLFRLLERQHLWPLQQFSHQEGMQAELRLGRDASNDLVIPDGRVSAHHLQVRVEVGGLVVVDQGSTNGTFVDGRRVSISMVQPNQSVHLGSLEVDLYALLGDAGLCAGEYESLAAEASHSVSLPDTHENLDPLPSTKNATSRLWVRMIAVAVFVSGLGFYGWYAVQANLIYQKAQVVQIKGNNTTAGIAYRAVIEHYPFTPAAWKSQSALANRSNSRAHPILVVPIKPSGSSGGSDGSPPKSTLGSGKSFTPTHNPKFFGASMICVLLASLLLMHLRQTHKLNTRALQWVVVNANSIVWFKPRLQLAMILVVFLAAGPVLAKESWRDKFQQSTRQAANKVRNSGVAKRFGNNAREFKRTTGRKLSETISRNGTRLVESAQSTASRYGPEVSRRLQDTYNRYGATAAAQLKGSYERYGPEVGNKIRGAFETYGPQVGEKLTSAYQAYGPAAGKKIQQAFDQYGPKIGQGVLATYQRYGPALGEQLRRSYETYGEAVGDHLRNAFEKHGKDAAQQLMQCYELYGKQVGEQVSRVWDQYGAEIGSALATAVRTHGKELGEKLGLAVEIAGHDAALALVELYRKQGQSVVRVVVDAYTEHGEELGNQTLELAGRLTLYVQDPVIQERVLRSTIQVSVLVNQDSRRLTHAALVLAMDNIPVRDRQGRMISLSDHTKFWVAEQFPYLDGSSITEDPAEAITYTLIFGDLDYVISEARVIRTPNGDFQTIGSVIDNSTGLDSGRIITAIDVLDGFETIGNGDADADDLMAAADIISSVHELGVG